MGLLLSTPTKPAVLQVHMSSTACLYFFIYFGIGIIIIVLINDREGEAPGFAPQALSRVHLFMNPLLALEN